MANRRAKRENAKRTKAWREKNLERSKRWFRERYWRTKHEAVVAYGSVCSCACGCGENVVGFLTFDHIYNDGAQHRRTTGNGTGVLFWAKKHGWPNSLALRCYNCNHGRARNNGRCPRLDEPTPVDLYIQARRTA